jgi:eukaryotic translation initiation factor 2C
LLAWYLLLTCVIRLLCLTLCREAMESHNGEADELPPPPPLAPGCEPIKAEETKVSQKPKRTLVPRNGFGRKGQQIKLCTNHFKVSLKTADEFFYHYYVSLHH